jgi:hypothetical protein
MGPSIPWPVIEVATDTVIKPGEGAGANDPPWLEQPGTTHHSQKRQRIVDACCAVEGWVVDVSCASRHRSINVDGNELRIDEWSPEGGSGGIKKTLVVQNRFGAIDEGLTVQGPVSAEPRKNRMLGFFARFVFKAFRSVRCNCTIGSMSLKHGADLLGFVECWLDANRLTNGCHDSSGAALDTCFEGYVGRT